MWNEPAKEIVGLLESRLRVLAQRGDLQGCVTTAEAMQKFGETNSGGLFNTALMWSMCSGVAKAQGTDAAPLAREYGDKAIDRLQQAIDAGFNDARR